MKRKLTCMSKSCHVLLFSTFVLFITVLPSCKKNLADKVTVNGSKGKDDPIPCFQFDWNTATNMPRDPASPGNDVPMPWNSGTSAIDAALVGDYHPADGWVLAYNT